MQSIDAIMNEQMSQAFKIRDRQLKTDILQEIHECKEKTAKLTELLRAVGNGNIDNYQLAQLNDLAYRGLQKRSL